MAELEETGSIAFWHERGYGFIAVDRGGKDVFVHAKDIPGCPEDGLVIGTRLSFEITEDSKSGKLRATGVEVLSE